MNNKKLIKKLKNSVGVRCKFWAACGAQSCEHYEPHSTHPLQCVIFSPVKYCRIVKGFVHDVPIHELDSNYMCDPNLAFKAKQDYEKRKGDLPF